MAARLKRGSESASLAKAGVAASRHILRVEHVTMAFETRDTNHPVHALDDVTLDIGRGEFVILLGPSGCGKSTLLNIVAGFISPSSGRVLHDESEVRGPDRRRTVVFQDYALFPWMTVLENIAFGLKAKGVARSERNDIARGLVSLVHLDGFENRYPHEISGGMKQRAAIARALAPEPDILLMDEPFGALDAQTRVLLQEEVAALSSEAQRTVLFVTHSIEEAVFLGDRIVVMSTRPGRIRSTHKVPFPRPRKPEIRRHGDFVAMTQDLWEALKFEWQQA